MPQRRGNVLPHKKKILLFERFNKKKSKWPVFVMLLQVLQMFLILIWKAEHFHFEIMDHSSSFVCKWPPRESHMVAPTAVMQRTGGADKCSEILKAIIITDTYKQSVSASDPRGSDIPHVLCLGSKLAVAALLCYGKIRPRYQEWHRRVCDVVIYMSLWDFKVLPPRVTQAFISHGIFPSVFQPCACVLCLSHACPLSQTG